METIPLFPLGSVLLPTGKMGLQIFEPRYLDLISNCLKHEKDFGVVLLREGSEIHQANADIDPRLAHIGTMAQIVDWDSLANGLLGVTIVGGSKFRLVSSFQRDDNLHMAEVELLAPEPIIAVPEQSLELKQLLLQLLDHPHVARLQFNHEIDDVATLGCTLAQILPIDEELKFALLAETDPLIRLQVLMDMLDEYSQ
jgi:Lon protease-like protein